MARQNWKDIDTMWLVNIQLGIAHAILSIIAFVPTLAVFAVDR